MPDAPHSLTSDNKSSNTQIHYPMARTMREPQPSTEAAWEAANVEMRSILYSSQPACPSDDAYSVSKLSDFTPPVYDETLLSIRTKTARQQEALRRHGMPDHWSAPRDNIGKLVFNTLCLMSFGHAGLEPLWGAIILEEEGDESVWAEQTRQTIDRLTNINVVAGLLLTSCATFITTFPPRPDMINYTLRGPYLCLLGSFALLIGGLIVGSAWVLVTGKTRPHWAKEVLYANRFHVYCTLATLSYPFISIGTATMILSFGLLSAVWSAIDRAVQGACAIILFFPIAVAILFGVSVATATSKLHLKKEQEVSV